MIETADLQPLRQRCEGTPGSSVLRVSTVSWLGPGRPWVAPVAARAATGVTKSQEVARHPQQV